MKMTKGILLPSDGTIFVNGTNVRSSPPKVKKLVSYLPDKLAIPPDLTVREMLSFIGVLNGIPESVLETRISKLTKQLSIERAEHHLILTLSMGERQRLAIATALLPECNILLLDEPFSGLDAAGVDWLAKLLKSMRRKEGSTIMLATHQSQILLKVCDRIGVMHKGRLLATREPDELPKQGKSSIDGLIREAAKL
jgi:ABC-2 type transport system ATP-binding protein